MINRIIWGAIATAMLATAGAAMVVAGSFALYQFLKEVGFSPAQAGASIAGVMALFLAIGGLIAMGIARGPKKKDESIVDRVVNSLKERPVMTAAAAVAALVVAVRNPAVVASVLAAFLGTQPRGRN